MIGVNLLFLLESIKCICSNTWLHHAHHRIMYSAESSESIDNKLYFSDSSKTTLVKVGLLAYEITIPKEVLVIKDGIANNGICAECKTTLKKVTFEKDIQLGKIGDFAFEGCNLIEEMEIPNSVNEIGLYSFKGCSLLRSVIISKTGSNLKRILDGAFQFCSSLSFFVFPNQLVSTAFASFETTNLSELHFPQSFSSITGEWSFMAMKNCKKVTFEEGCKLSTFPAHTFQSQSNLSIIEIPEYLNLIGDSCFASCVKLEQIVVHQRNTNFKFDGNGILFNYQMEKLLIYPPSKTGENYDIPNTVKIISSTAFVSCKYLKSIRISSSVSEIQPMCFEESNSIEFLSIDPSNNFFTVKDNFIIYNKAQTEIIYCAVASNNPKLENFIVPDSVKTLKKSCFMGVKALKNISFSASSMLTSWEENVFKLSGLKYFKVPNKISYLATYTANSCLDLEIVEFEENSKLRTIGFGCFNKCQKLAQIDIPLCVVNIEDYAFYNCGLISAKINGCMNSIGICLFQNCGNLESVECTNINCLTELKASTFEGCVNLKNVLVPKTLISIGAYCFKGCKSIENFDFLPQTLENIAIQAFEDCTLIKYFNVPESSQYIGIRAFNRCSFLEVVHIPDKVNKIANSAFFVCESMVRFVVKETSPYFVEHDGVLYSKNNSQLCAYPAGNKTSYYKLRDECKTILTVAFYGAKNLKYVEIPIGLNKVGDSSFEECDGLMCEGVIMKNSVQKELFYEARLVERALNVCPPTSSFTAQKSTFARGRVIISSLFCLLYENY